MDRSSTRGQADPVEPPARVVTLTSGDFTLTVNPVDGSEIVRTHRPGGEPAPTPVKRTPAARASAAAAVRPPVPPGAAAGSRTLLGREEERERLVRLLARGRSVRLTGPSGSGRTALLDAVADACADLAPDGVVRLCAQGHQQPGELLQALYATVYEAPAERPDRAGLLARVAEIGAVVVIDDLEMGGTALDDLLRATPECAYLLAATPDTKAPSDDSHLEEVFLGGLSRADCVALLEAGTGRALTDQETAWAGDLSFASEGLPLRFVQAAALLRQRDALNRTGHAGGDGGAGEDDEPGVFEEKPRATVFVPLPTLAEGAAPAELLASRVSESARAALRIACALGGELPHHTHLPALVGDTHADTAVTELLDCGLLTPVGTRYQLAAGVARQLEEIGYGDTAAEEARTAARHYAWWTGHTSASPERIAAEADAVLAALAGADVVAAVLLARTAAPAFAASLHWEAWERVLRAGAEAARKAGEVAEQAYFHHELGVLALCEGRLDRARAELEASTGLRGALADKRGTVAGRRALALVTDREAAETQVSPPLRLAPPAVTAGPAQAGPGQPGSGAPGVAGVLPVPGAPGVPAAPGPAGTPLAAGLSGLPGIPGPPGLPQTGPKPQFPALLGAPGSPFGPGSAGGAAAPRSPGGPGAGGVSGVAGSALAAGAAGAAGLAGGSGVAGGPLAAGAAAGAAGVSGAAGGSGLTGGSLAAGAAGTPSVPGARGARSAAGVASAPVVPSAPVTPATLSKALAALPAAGSEAVPGPERAAVRAPDAFTTVVPAVAPPGSVAPATLAEVFEDAFPLTPESAPAPRALPEPKPKPGRKPLLLAAAGAVTVVVLGTVVALAMTTDEKEPPAQAPAVSTAPSPEEAQPQPSTADPSGSDPSPEPEASSPTSQAPGTTPPPSKSPSATPTPTPTPSASSSVVPPSPPVSSSAPPVSSPPASPSPSGSASASVTPSPTHTEPTIVPPKPKPPTDAEGETETATP
ncbi:ATP-binding protein [Streptomyces sp. NPDC099050]|uniref:ATP-binding protein n=1 Tax=Streptomyces sp. NPDC099050 TaxID=3366100 RepID=UPI0038267649